MEGVSKNRDLADSLLASELATRQEGFGREISQLVASLGATGNRYSTALVASMEEAGRREIRDRAEIILGVWRRVLSSQGSDGSAELTDATDHALDRLANERSKVEETVLAVQMGSVPHHPDFLSATADLLRGSLPTELRLPTAKPTTATRAGADQDEVIEMKPNFFGIGVNLRALWRGLVVRWRR